MLGLGKADVGALRAIAVGEVIVGEAGSRETGHARIVLNILALDPRPAFRLRNLGTLLNDRATQPNDGAIGNFRGRGVVLHVTGSPKTYAGLNVTSEQYQNVAE